VSLVDGANVSTEDRLSQLVHTQAWIREGNNAGEPFLTEQMKAAAQHPGLTIARDFVEQNEPSQIYRISSPAWKDGSEDMIVAGMGEDSDALQDAAVEQAKAPTGCGVTPGVVMGEYE
jgi:hypothetical protein